MGHLPRPRGPISEGIISALSGGALPSAGVTDPFGEDLQLSLYVCYELHYQGFSGVDSGWEWDPDLLRLRLDLERVFLGALRDGVPGGDDVEAAIDELMTDAPGGVSHFLEDKGELWHLREYVAHRSIYHQKEADPHAWVIPRLTGQAKASVVAVEFDEYGGGQGSAMHSALFCDLMRGLDLDDSYLAWLDDVPAPMLAVVNLMSMFGLHRSLRGALVGHFAAAEITSSPSAARMTRALDRLGVEETVFFTEHVEADAVHEQVMRRDVIGDLLRREPELTADVVFGLQATDLVEGRFAAHLLGAWDAGRTSLREAADAR
ncbi:iron-containing redox enzyme family protein [Herbidospora mongoliensis]|uniref:iron-containing redox enzyme family protein n=1 Tax=Herbidospora mongoliensis TaxID=688067 RepID=UPI000829C063|nr:iron-containing redox enzyme family protein [Herbidospora mongoliensis]